jgi:hypothetical protein
MADPKAILAIIGKKAPGSDDDMAKPDSDDSSSDSEMGLDQASDEVLKAITDGDSSALKDALKSFVDQCGSSDYKSDSDKGE